MSAAYGVADLGLDLTRDLCHFLARVDFAALPPEVVHEARRGILDWTGCALAGSRHDAVARLLAVLDSVSGKPQATVIGRRQPLGLLEAATANGQMGHVLDFDDTHMGGVILHTSSPVLAALFALAEARDSDPRQFIAAYVCGFEAGIRVGCAAPAHHDGGWHLTGTLGTIAAGVACARLLGLDGAQTVHAAGIAATQAAGMQQNRGTMCKSLHAGRAAANGVLAALLAEQGFDSSGEIFEGRKGFIRIFSEVADERALIEHLGTGWKILSNGYKPYACGVVQHPLIDAMIELSRNHRIAADRIARVEARVSEAMIRITGVEEPGSGLKSKFSLSHGAAVAYLDRAAGTAQYSDERANAADVAALRPKITAVADDRLRRDQADVTLITEDGERFTAHVEHAIGTVDNPMSDVALAAKFAGNAAPVLGETSAADLAGAIWTFDEQAHAADIVRSCAGSVNQDAR